MQTPQKLLLLNERYTYCLHNHPEWRNATKGDLLMNNAVLDIDPQAFIAQLSDEEHMLIRLQKELYEGSWDAILNDLRNRLAGKPYIFKLPNKIRDDIARVKKLRYFEEQYDIKLDTVCTNT
jgi:hypothetical protein